MKTNKLAMLCGLALSMATLSACGGSSKKETISVWVGDDSTDFYQEKCNEFIENNPDFPYDIKVSGTDLGTIAGTILQDASAAADIYSVAHDNLGKLAQANNAKPLTDPELIAQIENDNNDSFIRVSKSVVNEKEDYYGAPYISQALFLMYDKRYVSDEQAKTFEGLAEAAKSAGEKVKGVEAVGDDGYNFSFTLLARENATKTSTLKIYENGSVKDGTFCQGDDEVAFLKWAQRYYADPNGLGFPTDATWPLDVQNHNALSIIGGSWHYNAFADAVGSTNVGLAMIPTFTLTSADAFEDAVEGSVYRGGTFADCKVMMINSNSAGAKYKYEQQIIKYLSSVEIQKQSFAKAYNVPSYKTFMDDLAEIQATYPDMDPNVSGIASVQGQMAAYGIAQPFVTSKLNNYYYQAGAPAKYKEAVQNKDSSYDTRKIQETLYTMQYIWQNGKEPVEIPEDLPVENTRQ